jgi:hypothetical protein
MITVSRIQRAINNILRGLGSMMVNITITNYKYWIKLSYFLRQQMENEKHSALSDCFWCCSSFGQVIVIIIIWINDHHHHHPLCCLCKLM